MGKKKHEEMAANREKFLAGAEKNNVPKAKAERLWELVEQFAGYGFNKSHSAAYALVAYQTAYLKTHYPVEFVSALLSSEIGNQDKLTKYLNECRDMSIPILPPDVNSSHLTFTPAGNSIRFGLTAIKNVGATAIESVLAARRKLGRFDTLLQFCENVDLRLLNKRVIESLIKAGAFDSLGARRSQHMAVLDRMMDLGQKRQRESNSGQHGLFMGEADMEPPPPLDLPDVPDWTEVERLAGEKEVMGFYVTGHPLEKYMGRLASITRHDSSSLEELAHESPVILAGILTGLRVRPSKKGDLWASGMLEDSRGSVELLVFPQAYQQLQGVLKRDAALLVKGRVRHEENQRTKVVLSEARPLDAAMNGGKSQLRIRVNLAQVGEGLAGELADLLSAHPGNNSVILELTRPGDFVANLRLNRPRAVKADEEVIAQLRALCGESAILLEKQE
jgi:DNA polymerase-3 subunit alpha